MDTNPKNKTYSLPHQDINLKSKPDFRSAIERRRIGTSILSGKMGQPDDVSRGSRGNYKGNIDNRLKIMNLLRNSSKRNEMNQSNTSRYKNII